MTLPDSRGPSPLRAAVVALDVTVAAAVAAGLERCGIGMDVVATASDLARTSNGTSTRLIVVTAGDDRFEGVLAEVREIRAAAASVPLIVVACPSRSAAALEMIQLVRADDWIFIADGDAELTARLAGIKGRCRHQTEHSGAVRALQSTIHGYEDLFERLPCGAYESTPDGRFLRVNSALAEILGYSSIDELLAIDIGRDLYVDPTMRPRLLAMLDTWDESKGVELVFRRQDGSTVVLLEHAYVRRDAAGRPASYVGTLSDITSRHEERRYLRSVSDRHASLAEFRAAALERANLELKARMVDLEKMRHRLEASEGRLRSLVENLSEGIYQASLEGAVEYASPALERLLQVPAGALVGSDMRQYIHPDDLPQQLRNLDILRRGGSLTCELRLMTTSGEVRRVLASSRYQLDAAGRPTIHGVVTDVTTRRELEERLRRAETLESLGHLAGSVVHDSNNYIAAISSAAELLAAQTDQPALRTEIAVIQRAAAAISELSRSLLAFARRQTLDPRPVDVAEVVADALPLLRRLAGPGVRVHHVAAGPPAVVQADRASLDRILVNLCLNARDAVTGRGEITIRTGLRTISDGPTSLPDLIPGEYAAITVADDGPGMPPEIAARAFEPFFSTKKDRGSGLGLASVYGTVKQQNGHVFLDTRPQSGTTVEILLPTVGPNVAGTAAPVSDHAAVTIATTSRARTVLVAEDNDDLRRVLGTFLSTLGYQPTCVANGDEALAELSIDGRVFDVVVTDIEMPGLDGTELYHRVRARRPHIGFVLCSGEGGLKDTLGLEDRPATRVVSKPFDLDTIARCVAEVLLEACTSDAAAYPSAEAK